MEHKDLASLIISKLIKIILVLIVLLFASNALWIWYINQYDFTTEYVEQETSFNENSTITFIIGGSNGLDPDIKNKSNFKLSFSKLTFPHQLFRINLLEQIYRSFKINNNESYHK